ncbi:MAG: hypothetical protein BRC32_06050 [Actinobacteria bacterium QS_8_72_14]|nr:MAG: hypothetical protein BRC32_06050 [Actinobacteria bacterium QS_8_72_14]
MDPAAASNDTATALRSALDAAYRERQALTERLDEIDQLIDDLSQAGEGTAQAPTRHSGATQAAGRAQPSTAGAKKTTRKKSATKTASAKKASAKKAGAKKSGAKKAGAKKASAKKTGVKKTGAKAATPGRATKASGTPTSRKTTGSAAGQEVGRIDRVVELIQKTDRPLTTGEVRAHLLEHEPAVTSKLVSASLSYAQRKGRIRKTNDGRWVAGGEAASSTG